MDMPNREMNDDDNDGCQSAVGWLTRLRQLQIEGKPFDEALAIANEEVETAAALTVTRTVSVECLLADRYPWRPVWRPVCSCGADFWVYASEAAAQTIADAHVCEKGN